MLMFAAKIKIPPSFDRHIHQTRDRGSLQASLHQIADELKFWMPQRNAKKNNKHIRLMLALVGGSVSS